MHVALTTSLLVHAALLITMPSIQMPVLRERPSEIEVSYYKSADRTEPAPPPMATALAPSPTPPAAPQRQRIRPAPDLPTQLDLSPTARGERLRQRPALPETIDLTNLAQLSSDAVAYVDYFRLLRERIRAAAIRHYPARSIQGEVYLTFTLTADGLITEARVVEERSTAERSLRAASLEALREAAPFPPFPKTLDRDRMTFKIIVAYELGRAR